MKNLIAIAGALLALSCSKSSSNGGGQPKTPAVVPAISINNVTQVRDTAVASTYTFAVSLSQQTTDTVTVSYATADSSAFANTDYTPSSGTLTFLPGNSVGVVKVTVKPSNLRAANSIFLIELSSPVNSTLSSPEGNGIIENHGNNLGSDTTGYQTPSSYVGYKPLWSDEFNESTVNTNYWQY